MIGQTISHYDILEKLGEGGMGVVYKARDTRLNRLVALKFLSDRLLESETERARFLQEARSAAALNHPNICGIIDIKQLDGEEFLVMEYLDGHTLRTTIGQGPLEVAAALRIARQIADGLTAAHGQGMIHRDIKPENIIITDAGIAKIADFGLAALVDETREPASGVVAGTAAYMSPEQVLGQPLDQSTDIWSLGITLYEMIAGRQPFSGEYVQAVRYAIVHDKHAPLSGVRPGVPPALDAIIDRCLEKAPALRYRSAADFADEIRQAEHAVETPPAVAPRSMAVLPFTDISPDKDNEYFSEGLTDEIITKLSKVQMVRVISRTSVMRYERTDKPLKQIASDLGVQYILEGSVRKQGSDLRITTQLIDASQDVSLWSEQYRGTMENIFDIQESVAAKIVKALKVRLTPVEKKTLKRRATGNTEAYQLYLKGRFFWNKRSPAAIETAIRYFEEALQKDPGYALAWSGLADANLLLSDFGTVPRRENYPAARKAIEKALQLDKQLAEAHTSLANLMMLGEWDWAKAGKEFQRAIRLRPNYATAHHWYSEWLQAQGRIEEAVQEINQAALLDPLSPAILKDKGLTLYYAGRFDEAIAEAKKTLEVEPAFASVHRLLSLCYEGKGMFEEALAENRKWEEGGANPVEAALARAHILGVAGKRTEAEQVINSLKSVQPANGIIYRGLALAHVALGEHDQAFQWLEKAYEIRSETLCLLKADPKLDPIRPDPRYSALLKKMGLDR